MPHRVYSPDSDVEREIDRRYDGEQRWPLVDSPYTEVMAPASVREVAAAIYGRPDTIDLAGRRPVHRRRGSGRPRRGGVRGD